MFNFLFSIEGRVARRHWWLMSLFLALFNATSSYIFNVNPDADPTAMLVFTLCTSLLSIWMSFASAIKRFHDRGKSGFWSLLTFVPVIGWIWVFIECGFLRGTDGENTYGPEV